MKTIKIICTTVSILGSIILLLFSQYILAIYFGAMGIVYGAVIYVAIDKIIDQIIEHYLQDKLIDDIYNNQ